MKEVYKCVTFVTFLRMCISEKPRGKYIVDECLFTYTKLKKLLPLLPFIFKHSVKGVTWNCFIDDALRYTQHGKG